MAHWHTGTLVHWYTGTAIRAPTNRSQSWAAGRAAGHAIALMGANSNSNNKSSNLIDSDNIAVATQTAALVANKAGASKAAAVALMCVCRSFLCFLTLCICRSIFVRYSNIRMSDACNCENTQTKVRKVVSEETAEKGGAERKREGRKATQQRFGRTSLSWF